MPKISIFDQKSWFFQSGYTCSYGRYMAGKMHLGCLRLILSAFTISGVLLVHFSKIRKNRFFDPFFAIYSYIYTHISWFRPLIGHMVLGGCLGTFRLFLAWMAVDRSGPMLLYSTMTKKSPKCEKRVFLQSMIYKGKNSPVEYSNQNILKVWNLSFQNLVSEYAYRF